MSIHPTTTSEEIEYVCDAIVDLAKNHKEWRNDYHYDKQTNEFTKETHNIIKEKVTSWFEL